MTCGSLCPAYDLNAGQTVATTLMWGVPTAFMTVGVPTISGCAPTGAYYDLGDDQPPANISLAYLTDSLSDLVPLITSASSNISSVPSFNVSWEPQLSTPANLPKVRPKRVDVFEIDDSGSEIRQRVEFEYDSSGRLTRQITRSAATRHVASPKPTPAVARPLAASPTPLARSPLARTTRRAPRRLPRASAPANDEATFEERYTYEDVAHPTMVKSRDSSHDSRPSR